MYISLHNRSSYSFGSSLLWPAELAELALRHRMPAVALTDWCGLYGAVAFGQACRQAGVQPIIGVELPFRATVPRAARDAVQRVTLLALSPAGYGNLSRLASLHHLREHGLRAEDLLQHAEGLVCLAGGCEPEQNLKDAINTLREGFGGRCYVELALHAPQDAPQARRRAALADELGLPVVATPEARCRRRREGHLLRALASIGTLTLLNQPHPDKPAGHWHFRTPAEMQRLFARRPDALRNTLTIAEQCRFELELGVSRFPAFVSPDGRTAVQTLRDLCLAGCRRRYLDKPPFRGLGGHAPTWEQIIARLERELSIIQQVQYSEYFLVFHEIVEYCHRHGIATLARGSAADSLVCYALGVSHACPFRFDLPFDRFVNPERAKFSKMADIDLDLPWDQRDQVINWVYDRWGHDRVAMIGSANTFHARAAVVELGKVYGLPPHEVHAFSRRLPHYSAINLVHSIRRSPETRGLPLAEEPYRTIISMAEAFEGLPRHWSMHPCGLVVSPSPLTDLVPVQRSPKGPLVAQYDMDAIEELGFIKIDLLGQAGLSVLRDVVAEVKRSEGIEIDLECDVDYAEPETWELIASGQARGIHHIESPAMTSLLQQTDCRDIDCLTSIVAIIRPGAANQGKKEKFARRYQGFEPPEYAHPSLVPVLEGTYGLMVFEEHILQIAVEFAGMNIGRADVLRRALNKENGRLIREMKAEFHEHARRLGRTEGEIHAVWSVVEGFKGFMFNKAHSAEYALEAFQGAWLKRRWPAHYLAAVLANYRGFYAHSPTLPQILYVMEALRHGARLLPPCINRSRPRFAVERHEGRDCIRIPVGHIKGLSAELIARHQTQRERGPFSDLGDFLIRCEPSPSDSLALLNAGALDGLGEPRPRLFWRTLRHLRSHQGGGLFGSDIAAADTLPGPLTEPDIREIARLEMDLLGFPVSIDPLTFLGTDGQGRSIDWDRYVPVKELGHHLGRRVEVCGLVVADRVSAATTGELMKFITLADHSGCVETMLFPKEYRRLGHLTAMNPILAVSGVVEPFENRRGFTLQVLRLEPGLRRDDPIAAGPTQAPPRSTAAGEGYRTGREGEL